MNSRLHHHMAEVHDIHLTDAEEADIIHTVLDGYDEPVREAARQAFATIFTAMRALIEEDQISMLRHPEIVDGLHKALNRLKGALNATSQPTVSHA